MNTDRMCSWASELIWRAEWMEDQGRDASQPWREVSDVQERLVEFTPVGSARGFLVRDGAVRAALKAGDPVRARDLARRFCDEAGVPDSLCDALWQLIDEDERGITTRFPPAAEHHRLDDVQELARRIHEAGTFGLAA